MKNLTFTAKIWLGFSLVLMLILAVILVIQVNFAVIAQTEKRIAKTRIPTAHSSKEMLIGIQGTLASLRGWILLKDPVFKKQRAGYWQNEIGMSLATMKMLSLDWTNPDNIKTLNQLQAELVKFRQYQDEIEVIADSDDNKPAAKILTLELTPANQVILDSITAMINEEARQKSAEARMRLFKAMADFRASISQSQVYIELYVLLADKSYLQLYQKQWQINEARYLQLVELSPSFSARQQLAFSRLTVARNKFAQLVDRMQEIMQGQKSDLANHWLATRAIPLVSSIESKLAQMSKDQEMLLVADFNQHQQGLNRLERESSILFGTVILLILCLAIMIVRAVVRPIHQLLAMTVKIGNGEYAIDTQLTGSVEMMRLGRALEKMKQQIAERAERLEQQNWLTTQENRVMELTQGVLSLSDICELVISHLARSFEAGHGVFYLANQVDKDGQESLSLSLCGSYAFTERKELSAQLQMGEGLAGQAAKEGKPILLTRVPGDYIRIKSALGQQQPMNILAYPVMHENNLVGIIELASFVAFTDRQLQLLEKVSINLGIIIDNVANRNRTEKLLVETQNQALELNLQKEELRSVNENLESRAQQLKLSQEELQQQSEELRVSNEELSEKQKTLIEQSKNLQHTKAELEKKAEELTTTSKYKSEFLANMSHELRTPLNSLLILSKSLANNDEGNLTDEQLEDAKVIHEGGLALLMLINDIMDLSKVEAGKLTVHIESMSLETVCRDLELMFAKLAQQKQVEFSLSQDADVPAVIQSDIQRLEQILKNFMSNAFKFTSKGSVRLRIHRPLPELQQLPDYIEADTSLAFSVIDTGIGIADDKQVAIFEAFQQEDGSINRKYGGTGLGLAISRELAHLLGGEIKLQSTLGQGSVFTLYLPLHLQEITPPSEPALQEDRVFKAAKAEARVNACSPPEKMTPPGDFLDDDREIIQESDKTLLVIEDDIHFARVLVKVARKEGFKCLATDKGREGLLLAQQFLPMGIILDLGLPDINGLTVLEQLKFNLKTRHIPVHIASGADCEQDSLNSGAFSFLAKPVANEQIGHLLSSLVKTSSRQFKQVLVIEDDLGNQQAITKLIAAETIRVDCVDCGAKALEYLGEHKVDCIILDLGLPDMSGVELLTTIKQFRGQERVPVIVYTGKDIPDDEYKELCKISEDIIVKGAESPERLLDDVSLFLHSIQSAFSMEQQKTLKMLHDQSTTLSGQEILLVDDDMRNIFALSRELEKSGVNVTMAENGQVALEKIAERDAPFDLILMDIMMPEMDGLTAIREIRKISVYQQVPIIALTAKAMPEDKTSCIEAGASEYLTKPVDMERLLSMMQIWLF
ncbi:response regulator [Thalassomonas sp. RHCl1]|uniref:response regulator n=1 Tax=Thalassomonas sp. RHCl1 TaxID=2995320 RepID=UPI00248B161B|nr:response regulator [Thalassomonas sp. RHCl1]